MATMQQIDQSGGMKDKAVNYLLDESPELTQKMKSMKKTNNCISCYQLEIGGAEKKRTCQIRQNWDNSRNGQEL